MAHTDKLTGQHCGWCHRALGVGSADAGPQGPKLVLAAVGVFLAPLLLALLGALALSVWGSVGSILGGAGGFILGLAAAAVARRLIAPPGSRGRGGTTRPQNDEA